jgi:Transcriptional regulator, AbiEi antitoxin/AbiEi antitoxin C-terminal domain/Protein of unknown function (DUF559)
MAPRTQSDCAVLPALREELRVVQFAAARHRVIRTSELQALGISTSAICRWTARGRLRREHLGVYVYGGGALTQDGRLYAAQVAIGDDAAVGWAAAALLCGFWPYPQPQKVDVIVPRRVRSRRRITVHNVIELPDDAVIVVRGVRVTTPARTAIDLAGSLQSDRAFRRTVHEGQAKNILRFGDLVAEFERAPACFPGKDRVFAELEAGPTRTRSGLEERVVDILRAGDYPPYETNAHLPDLPSWVEVDVFFGGQKLVVEIDSDKYHKTPWRREQDAFKRELLKNAGYRVLVITEDEVDRTEELIRAELLELAGALA